MRGPHWFRKLCYSTTVGQVTYTSYYILHGYWYREQALFIVAGALTKPLELAENQARVPRGEFFNEAQGRLDE